MSLFWGPPLGPTISDAAGLTRSALVLAVFRWERGMSGQKGFPGRVAIQQRVLPAYRVPFFDKLASLCSGGVEVFAGGCRSERGRPGRRPS